MSGCVRSSRSEGPVPCGAKRFQTIYHHQCRRRIRALASLRIRHQGPCMGLFESSRMTHFFHRRFLGSISPGLIVTASSTVVRWGGQSEGSALSGAIQSRRNLVSGRSKDPNHDAVMRIGSEAPKRRTHSSNRHESQGTCRESATSNRHRYPITSVQTGPKLSGYLSVLQSLCRTQNDAVRYNALPHEPPQSDQ